MLALTPATQKKKVISSLFHQKHSIRAPETWCSKAAHSRPPWLDPSSATQICWLLCWISDYIFNSFSSDVSMAIKVKYTYVIPHRCCFLKLRLKQARWSRSSLSSRFDRSEQRLALTTFLVRGLYHIYSNWNKVSSLCAVLHPHFSTLCGVKIRLKHNSKKMKVFTWNLFAHTPLNNNHNCLLVVIT